MSTTYLYPTRLFYPVTYVEKTSEHHLPLKGTRSKVGNAIQNFFVPDSVTRSPHVDIRETATKYYVDTELPGVGSAADIQIQWSNPRTDLIRAEVKRTPTAEEKAAAAEGADKKRDTPVHFLTTERTVGTIMRAFDFVVDVDRESLKAELQNGLLTIVIDKKPRENVKGKTVNVVKA